MKLSFCAFKDVSNGMFEIGDCGSQVVEAVDMFGPLTGHSTYNETSLTSDCKRESNDLYSISEWCQSSIILALLDSSPDDALPVESLIAVSGMKSLSPNTTVSLPVPVPMSPFSKTARTAQFPDGTATGNFDKALTSTGESDDLDFLGLGASVHSTTNTSKRSVQAAPPAQIHTDPSPGTPTAKQRSSIFSLSGKIPPSNNVGTPPPPSTANNSDPVVKLEAGSAVAAAVPSRLPKGTDSHGGGVEQFLASLPDLSYMISK
jgi:hypothetical protein